MIKIVIVEDEDLIRQGLKLTIDWESFGCIVTGDAKDGSDGLDLIIRTHPDIVITDIRMPRMNGFDMIEKIPFDDISYIILSGYDDFSYAQKAIKFGVAGYLLKPIDDKELEQILVSTISTLTRQRNDSQLVTMEWKNIHADAFLDKYITKAFQIMKNRFAENLTLNSVAEELNISESYLGKLFKKKTSYTFLDMLTFYRIKAAINFLENTDMKVYEIAFATGYADAKYFSRVFQKIIGVKPTEYRKGLHIHAANILNQLQ